MSRRTGPSPEPVRAVRAWNHRQVNRDVLLEGRLVCLSLRLDRLCSLGNKEERWGGFSFRTEDRLTTNRNLASAAKTDEWSVNILWSEENYFHWRREENQHKFCWFGSWRTFLELRLENLDSLGLQPHGSFRRLCFPTAVSFLHLTENNHLRSN